MSDVEYATTLHVGDIVVERNSGVGGHLCCGSGQYSHAICVSLEPFVLVSQEGDMQWSRAKPEHFRSLRAATEQEREHAFDRFHQRGHWAPPPSPNELREYGESA